MSTRVNRRQSQQFFRLGIIGGIVGILVILIGFGVYFLIDQGTRRSPLDIALYAGAQAAGQTNIDPYSRSLVYRVPGATADQVAEYYNQRLREFSNGEDSCVRLPDEGNFEGYQVGDNTTVPYQYVCLFDRSFFNMSQWTRVTIQPGVFNEDANLNTEGMAVVEYYQQWNP